MTMTAPKNITPAVDELARLLESWELSLRAARLSPKTIRNYMDTGRQLLRFLDANGMPTRAPNIRREHIETWIVALGDAWSPSTAATRYRCLQQFFRWLIEECEITESPMRN